MAARLISSSAATRAASAYSARHAATDATRLLQLVGGLLQQQADQLGSRRHHFLALFQGIEL